MEVSELTSLDNEDLKYIVSGHCHQLSHLVPTEKKTVFKQICRNIDMILVNYDEGEIEEDDMEIEEYNMENVVR